jgi:hypothetical protein
MFPGSVKGTGYPLHSPVSPSLPSPVRHRLPSHFNWTLKQLGCEVNQSPSASAEVKSEATLLLPPIPAWAWAETTSPSPLHRSQYKFYTGIELNYDYNSYVVLDTRAYVGGE